MPSSISAYDVYKPNVGREFVTPAGVRMTVKTLELEDMAVAGIIDNLDTLGMLVEEKKAKVQGKKPQDRAKKKPTKAEAEAQEAKQTVQWLRDPEKFAAIGSMLNKVLTVCVLEPVFESPYITDPETGEERVRSQNERLEGALYADYVPLGDKMAIFKEVFQGMASLEGFREGSGEDVADVADGAESGDSPV